jgi:hypothetical protein
VTPDKPMTVSDELERTLFSELIKRGIDQDTADQVSQAVCENNAIATLQAQRDELREALQDMVKAYRAYRLRNGDDESSDSIELAEEVLSHRVGS